MSSYQIHIRYQPDGEDPLHVIENIPEDKIPGTSSLDTDTRLALMDSMMRTFRIALLDFRWDDQRTAQHKTTNEFNDLRNAVIRDYEEKTE